MREFKDCVVQGKRIILKENLTPERYQQFLADFYTGQIPIFKMVAILDYNGSLQTIQEADHVAPDPLSILNMMDRYCPAHQSLQAGQYEVEETAIRDLDENITSHRDYLQKVQIPYTHSQFKTGLIFNKNVDINDICQVYYYTREITDEDCFPTLNELKGGMQGAAVSQWYTKDFLCVGDGKFVRRHIKSFNSNDFYQWGYPVFAENKAPTMKSLVNLELPMLYTDLTPHVKKMATPIFLCYRGTGTMTNAEIRKNLFKMGLDFSQFYFPPMVRFSLQDYVGITQRYTSNNIPYVNVRDKVDESVLQEILNHYGEIE